MADFNKRIVEIELEIKSLELEIALKESLLVGKKAELNYLKLKACCNINCSNSEIEINTIDQKIKEILPAYDIYSIDVSFEKIEDFIKNTSKYEDFKKIDKNISYAVKNKIQEILTIYHQGEGQKEINTARYKLKQLLHNINLNYIKICLQE